MTAEKIKSNRKYLPVGKVANMTGTSRQLVSKMVDDGIFSTLPTPGGRHRIPESEVLEYIETNFRPRKVTPAKTAANAESPSA